MITALTHSPSALHKDDSSCLVSKKKKKKKRHPQHQQMNVHGLTLSASGLKAANSSKSWVIQQNRTARKGKRQMNNLSH